jgi:hypothetical protein
MGFKRYKRTIYYTYIQEVFYEWHVPVLSITMYRVIFTYQYVYELY